MDNVKNKHRNKDSRLLFLMSIPFLLQSKFHKIILPKLVPDVKAFGQDASINASDAIRHNSYLTNRETYCIINKLSHGPVMVSTGVLRYDKRGGQDNPVKMSKL